jgi:excisionase family DNA binding protein
MSETPAVKKQMVSPAEAAAMWSVDRETILRWIRDGKLPAVRLSRRVIRIRVADLDALEKQHAA